MNCLECHTEFHGARWTQRYCSDACQYEAKKRRQKEKDQRYRDRLQGKPVIIELPDDEKRRVKILKDDPLEGFPVGAELPSKVVKELLVSGYMTPGAVLLDHGRKCRVDGRMYVAQRLIELEAI